MFDNEYEYDYDRIVEDTDELYQDDYDNEPEYSDEPDSEWENYYHTLVEDIE